MRHVALGASSSPRWMACAGSINAIAALPEGDRNPTSPHAEEGTQAHALAEAWLNTCIEAGCPVDCPVDIYPADMVEAVEKFVGHVFNRWVDLTVVDQINPLDSGDSCSIHIEQEVSLAALNPPRDMMGTADAVTVAPPVLYVDDYKHGRGTFVNADTSQGKYYALGTLLGYEIEQIINHGYVRYPIEEVVVTIVQPRFPSEHPIRSQVYNLAEMWAFAAQLLNAADRTTDPNAERVAGDHCKFCPVKARCPEQLGLAQSVAMTEFDDAPPIVELLTIEQIARVVKHADQIEGWIKSVRAHAHTLIHNGTEVPGFKLVRKRSNRVWADEDATAKWLRKKKLNPEKTFTTKIKSPAQIEKLLKGTSVEIPAKLIHKPDAGTTLAAESDPREAVEHVAAADEFDALTAAT